MQRYYLNKLKNIENKVAVSEGDEIKILTYCSLPNKQIKADLQIGLNGVHEPILFNTEEELANFTIKNNVTLCIDGLDIDAI